MGISRGKLINLKKHVSDTRDKIAERWLRDRKQIGIAIDLNVLAQMLFGGKFKIDSRLPKTAEFRWMSHDNFKDRIIMVFEDESFGNVPMGDTIPIYRDMIVVTKLKRRPNVVE